MYISILHCEKLVPSYLYMCKRYLTQFYKPILHHFEDSVSTKLLCVVAYDNTGHGIEAIH